MYDHESLVIAFYNGHTAGQQAVPWSALSDEQRDLWRINYDTRITEEYDRRTVGISRYFPIGAVLYVVGLLMVIGVVIWALAINRHG